MTPLPVAFALLAFLATAAHAASADEPQFVYTNVTSEPERDPAITALWSDYTKEGEARWQKEGGFKGRPFPANVLTAHFDTPDGTVIVSTLMTFYDCEMPGTEGSQTARCPLRVQYGNPPNVKLKTVTNACWLHYSPDASPGPDPARNHLTASLDESTKTVTVGAIEDGSTVDSCNLAIPLD